MRVELRAGGSAELFAGLVRVTLEAAREEAQRPRRGGRVQVAIAALRCDIGPRRVALTLARASDPSHQPHPTRAIVPLSLWLAHALALELVAAGDGSACLEGQESPVDATEIAGDPAALDPGAARFLAWWGVIAADGLEGTAPAVALDLGADPRAVVPDLAPIPGFACTLDPESTGALQIDFYRGAAGFYARARGGCEVWEERLYGPYPAV